MPVPRHIRLRRSLPMLTALGLTAGTAALAALAAPAAHADPACGRGPLQYSVDGGAHWTAAATMPAQAGSVQVRLAGEPAAGCEYHVSLGSYATQGATWATSGKQTFLGWATTTLSREHYRDTLDVTGHLPPCYGESALYAVGEKYDGSDSDHPLPHYPDEPFSGLMIASWNGGTACAPTPTPTPTTGPTTAAPTQTPTAVPTPTTAPVTTPPSPSPTPSPDRPTASPRADRTTPAAATPAATSAPTLAATGSDDGLLAAAGVAAAVLLAAGGAAVYVGRRR
ncbi:hypothetical protein ABTY61_20810 [Kitasatospora sp. NPDC096128]|uniref:hypothetical protein n=1 Tax=Kitasatospora sp. NPDC096128 TaxID=3155547 RepID=UPI00331E1395